MYGKGTLLNIFVMQQVKQLQHLRQIAGGDEMYQLRGQFRRIIESIGIFRNDFIRQENLVLGGIIYRFLCLLEGFPYIHEGICITADTGKKPDGMLFQQIVMELQNQRLHFHNK